MKQLLSLISSLEDKKFDGTITMEDEAMLERLVDQAKYMLNLS